MSTLEENISTSILKAVDTVVDKKLSEAGYDKTIEATVVDNSHASKGVYVVFYGAAQWEVYSQDTSFEIGDVVQVLIPSNDTRRTKTIVGKVSSKNKATEIKQPFNDFIDVTGNIIDTVMNSNKSLLANGSIENKIIWTYTGDLDLINYSTIGLEVEFQSIINKAVEGEYGLLLQITGNSDFKDEFLELWFNTEDLLGNPYDYPTFIKQQKLFDISKFNFKEINNITLYFYQNKNSFYDSDKSLINSKDSFGNDLPPNLFIDNPKLFFGFMQNEKIPGKDEVKLSVAPGYSTDYNLNNQEAIVNLQWLCWNNDNTKILSQEKIQNDVNYKIEWYYYRLESYVKAEIEKNYQERTGQFKDLIDDDADLLYIQLIDNIGCSYINNRNWQRISEYDNQFNCKVIFQVNAENEYRLRAFVFKDDIMVESDNILTFTNTSQSNLLTEEKKPGVKITAEDGSFGNYYCYTGTGILNNEDKKTRILKATFYNSENEEVILDSEDENILEKYDVQWTWPTKDTLLKCRQGTTSSELIYTISNIYDISKTNNTIICTITEFYPNGTMNEYQGTFDFNFGQSGNIYGNNTLVIDYVNLLQSEKNVYYTRNAIEENSEQISYIVRMFNSTNQEIDLMDQGYTIEWKLNIYNGNTGDFIKTISTIGNNNDNIVLNKNGQQLLITNSNKFNYDFLYILQAIVTNNNGVESIISYPVAISKNLKDYNHIRGCTSVVYQQIGNTIYDSKEYLLYAYNELNNPYENISWELIGDSGINAQLKIENNIIKPNGAYFKNETGCYGIKCLDEENNILWLQPIIILRSAFESTTINNWDGHSVDINDENGSVAATVMAAGKKEQDGSFTGVMIGDITRDINSPTNITTGIYGFHQGENSFGLLDDGTAFIGKAGNGRIELDGNNSWLTSSGYKNGKGMFLDLDDAILDFKNGNYFVNIDASNPQSKNDIALKIGFGDTPNFSVNWNGDLRATNAYFQGKIENNYFKVESDGTITSTKGKIGGWNIDSTSLSNGNMVIDSSDGINFNNVFTVDSAGSLTATEATIEGDITADRLIANTSGEIGGWTISSDGLANTNGSQRFLLLTESSGTIVQFGDNFKVSADGQLDVTNLNVLGTFQINSNGAGRINNFIQIKRFGPYSYNIGKNKYTKKLSRTILLTNSNLEGYVPVAITRVTTGCHSARPYHVGIRYGRNDGEGSFEIIARLSKYPRKTKYARSKSLYIWILFVKGSGEQLYELDDADDLDEDVYDDDEPGNAEPDDASSIIGEDISINITKSTDPDNAPFLVTGPAHKKIKYIDLTYAQLKADMETMARTAFKNGQEDGGHWKTDYNTLSRQYSSLQSSYNSLSSSYSSLWQAYQALLNSNSGGN